MAGTIPERDHELIRGFCAEGDELLGAGDHAAAINKYRAAWELVPSDKVNWEASTWILSSVGEAYFQIQDFPTALNRYERAVQCPGGLGNPYIHLRLGQLYYETGNHDASADELTRAYMGAGSSIFEDDDPKYLDFLKTRLKPPTDGW